MEGKMLEELEKKLHQASSEQDVIQILGDAGIEASPKLLREAQTTVEGELSEEDLEDICGGAIFPFARLGLKLTRYILQKTGANPLNGGNAGGSGGGRF